MQQPPNNYPYQQVPQQYQQPMRQDLISQLPVNNNQQVHPKDIHMTHNLFQPNTNQPPSHPNSPQPVSSHANLLKRVKFYLFVFILFLFATSPPVLAISATLPKVGDSKWTTALFLAIIFSTIFVVLEPKFKN